MEALVAIVAELLIAATIAVVGVCATMAMAAIDLVGFLITGALVARSTRTEAEASAPAPAAQPRPEARKRRRHWLLIPLGLVGAASLLISFVFLEPTTHWAVERLAARAGFAVAFEAVEGNLYSGRFAFRNVTVLRPPGKRAGFDLRIGKAAIDVDLCSVIFRPIHLENLELDVVSGQITKPARPEPPRHGTGRVWPKRRFIVDRLAVHDARLWITGADGTDSHLEIATALSQPLRSDLAVFDFFFRSTVDATIDGHPIWIATEEIPAGRRTRWRIDEFPVTSLAGLVPRPPIRWFEGGTVSARLDDQWRLGEADGAIDTDWTVTMRGVTVQVPPDAGAAEKLTATALAKVVNGRTDDVTFHYRLVLDPENFHNAVSLDAAGFWKALVAGAARSIAERYGGNASEFEQEIRGATSRLKSFLQNRQSDQK